MDYKIINFDRNTGLITVLYNKINNYKLTLMIPIIDGKFIVGDELDMFIKSFEPQENGDRMFIIDKISNIDDIESLVDIKEKSNYIREIRNNLLKESDYTQVLDNPLSLEQQNKWKSYRQKLRDMTSQSGFPIDIVWPKI